MAFNLPYSVRISNEAPIDGERYIRSNQTEREQLITDGRAHEGLQVYQTDISALYILKTLGATPATSTWDIIGTGAGSTIWALNGNDAYNTNSGNISIGGTPSPLDKLKVYGRLTITTGAIYTDDGDSNEWSTAYQWGDHSTQGYITSGSTDTLTNKSGNISQWTNDSGYLTSYTETDPTVGSHIKSITTTNISNWNSAYNNNINTNPSFNTSTGVLTFTQQDASTLTVDLDGRYVTPSSTDTFTNKSGNISQWTNDSGYITSYINNYANSLSYNSSTNVLTIGRQGLTDLTTTINAGTTVNFSSQNRIPYMNVAGDNFLYSGNLSFNGSDLSVNGAGNFFSTVTASGFVVGTNTGFLKANGTIDNTSYLSGIIGVNNGGTGKSTFTTGIIYSSAGGAAPLTSSSNLTFNGSTLNVIGTGIFSSSVTASDFIISSDINLKDNITYMNTIDNSNIDNIDIINFTFKNDDTDRVRYGVIAQDLEKYYPELVYEDNGYKQVSYIGFILSKLNYKDKQIEELKLKLEELEKKIK